MNCLIIGCGNKGAMADIPGSINENKFLSYAHAVKISESFNFDDYNFIDINKDREKAAYKNWNIPITCLKSKYDIVIIATNDNKHYQPLIYALTFNPRIVICEKPLTDNIFEAEKVLEEYSKRNVPILVNYTRRYINKFKDVREKIENLGELVHGYLYFNGGWEHTASHFIDMIRWFGLEKYVKKIKFHEIKVSYKYIYQWALIFQNDFISETVQINRINEIYNNNTKEVLSNALDFLTDKKPLICTGWDAYKSLKLTQNIENDYISGSNKI